MGERERDLLTNPFLPSSPDTQDRLGATEAGAAVSRRLARDRAQLAATA